MCAVGFHSRVTWLAVVRVLCRLQLWSAERETHNAHVDTLISTSCSVTVRCSMFKFKASLASIILYTSLSSGTPASFSQHWVLKISKKVIRGCRVAASRLVSTAHVQLSTEMRERRDVSLLSNFRYHRHKNKKTMHLIQNFTGQDMNITNVSPWSSSCTESLSALQRSGVWIRPVAICCMSSVSFHFLSFL